MWPQLSSFDDARQVLPGVLPDLVSTYGVASAALAAQWYEDARDVAQVAGRFTAVPAVIDDDATQQLIDWAVSVGFNLDTIKELVSGGVSRRVQDWGRLTVVTASLEDPKARGWMRVGRPSHCDWCNQYLDGEIHYVTGYDFKAHDHCHCQAVPAW